MVKSEWLLCGLLSDFQGFEVSDFLAGYEVKDY